MSFGPSARSAGRAAARLGTLAALAALAAASTLAAPRVPGLDVRSARVLESGDTLVVEVALGGFFSPRVRGNLERGMPATLLVTTDLWRHRAGWFDRLVTTRSALYRVRFDAWREDYEVQRDLERGQHLDSLGAVARALERPLRLALEETRALTPGRRHYVVVTASLRPLTPEGLREVEQFLSSQLRGSGGAGGASGGFSIARLPSSLFSALAALSGMGDEIAVHRTPDFAIPARTGPPAGTGR